MPRTTEINHQKIGEFMSKLPKLPDVAELKLLVTQEKQNPIEQRRLLARRVMGLH